MFIIKPVAFMLILFVSNIIVGWSDTFMIETQIHVSTTDLSDSEQMRVIKTESGVMDVLFESGHIFFNVYSSPDEEGRYAPIADALSLAKKTGADYLVELIPDEDGVTCKLYNTIDSEKSNTLYEDINQVDESLRFDERWKALGAILGRNMLKNLYTGG